MPNHDLEFLILNYRPLTPPGYSLLQRLAVERAKTLRAEFLRELWRRVLSWRQHRVALTQLRALDDAALKDIGLHRSGIEAAVLSARPRTERPQRRHFPEKPHLWLQRTG
ncbi:MAG: hypothetical protein QOD94_1154 [Alphaproteobacteria bacterium]|nr:hypothetical protein [Alphaproteobacteria bacterium]